MHRREEILPPLTLRLLAPEPMLNDLSLATGELRRGGLMLALLVLRPEHAAPREWLREAFWPGFRAGKQEADEYLSAGIVRLRRLLGEGRLPKPRHGAPVRVNLEGADVDWLRFWPVVERMDGGKPPPLRGSDHAFGAVPAPSAPSEMMEPASLREAVTCYRGPLLAGCNLASLSEETRAWIEALRQGAEQRFLAACEWLACDAMQRGDPAEAIQHLLAAVDVAPFRATSQRIGMVMQAERGDYAALIETYADLCLSTRERNDSAPPPDRLQQVEELRAGVAEWARRRPHAGSSRRLPPRWPGLDMPGALPSPLTELMGREEELAAIRSRLPEARLLTLLGVGGVGKTRVAIQVAQEVARDDVEGVRFVPLEDLSDPDLVAQTVAAAIGIREPPDRRLTQALVEHLRAQPLLLVLDNCEHLAGSCVELIEPLLSHCPRLRILVTSRRLLGIEGEIPHPVPPLALPPGAVGMTATSLAASAPQQLLDYAAVRLFVRRAETARPGFALSHENAAAVAAVCRRLDGIPLAIELAAARLKVMAVEEVAAGLVDRFRLLKGGGHRTRPRQRTLLATMEWSENLLSVPARVLLRRLSVFAGGCTREAVDEVCTDSGSVDLLEELSDSSLLLVEAHPETARYRMLETVRAYAWRRLQEAEEVETIRDRHLVCFLRLAEENEAPLRGTERGSALARLEREQDSLRAALDWARQKGDAQSVLCGLRLAAALERFWELRGYAEEGRQQIETLLAIPTNSHDASSARVRVKSLHVATRLARARGLWELAGQWSAEALALCRKLGTPQEEAVALRHHAHSVDCLGCPTQAHALLADAIALQRAHQDRRGLADSLFRLGASNIAALHPDRARGQLEECLSIRREIGDEPGVATALCYLGVAHHFVEPETARRYYEESLALCRRIGHRDGAAYVLLRLGTLARQRGDFAAAQACWEEMLALWSSIGDLDRTASALFYLGLVALDQHDPVRAQAYLDECLALARQTDGHLMQARCLFALSGCAEDEATADNLTTQAVTACLEAPETIVPGLESHAAGRLAGGDARRAARLLGAAKAAGAALAADRAAPSFTPLPEPDGTLQRTLVSARDRLGDPEFTAAYAEGCRLNLDGAILALLNEA